MLAGYSVSGATYIPDFHSTTWKFGCWNSAQVGENVWHFFGEYLTGDDKEYTTGYTVSGFEKNHSFKVKDKLADKQFECVRGEMADLGDCLNIAAADAQVPKV